MFLNKETRLMAVAALPLCLFVFIYSQGKSAGYFLPEVMLYYAGLGVSIFYCLEFLALRLRVPSNRCLPAVGMCLLIVVVAASANPGITNIPIRLSAPVLEMDVARAAGKAIVGGRALVAGRIGMWYVSGASAWYSLESDLLWRRDISSHPLPEYFRNFDFVVEYGHRSFVTLNSRLESLPSWYMDRLLLLRGFYLSSNHPDINYLVFQPSPTDQVTGFVSDHDALYRFDRSSSGQQMFTTAVCLQKTNVAVNPYGFAYFTAMYLPMPDATDPLKSLSLDAGPEHPRSVLFAGMMRSDKFESRRLTAGCTVLEEVRGDLTVVDRDRFVRAGLANDRPIRFYENLATVVEERRQRLH